MAQRLPGDADGEVAHVGEVGQTEPARAVLLPEDHVALRAIHRPPGADAALQSSTNARIHGESGGGCGSLVAV